MSQYFEIHAQNPQLRLLKQAADIVKNGGVVVYPTDSSYAIGCGLTNNTALERIRKIRRLSANHLFAIICKDLSELSNYSNVSNEHYRLIRRHTPGPFTFILKASRDVPRRVVGTKRREIGLRIPDCRIVMCLLAELNEPILSTSLVLPDTDTVLVEPQKMRQLLEHEVDVILDGGVIGEGQTTLVNLTQDVPIIARQGIGQLLV